MKNTFKGFGPIYVINLKHREDRRKHIEAEFKKHNIKDYEFFEAVDGSDESIKEKIICNNIPISNAELACTMSHLSAIKHWLETDNSDYAIFMEDDLSFETVEYWQWTWQEFLSKIKDNYDMLQLCIINTRKINTSLHLREAFDSSANCYLITRERAKRLVEAHFAENKIKLPETRYYAVADSLVYTMARCYSFPLFTYLLDKSDLSEERNVDTTSIHEKSKNEVLQFWSTKPKHIYKKINGGINNG